MNETSYKPPSPLTQPTGQPEPPAGRPMAQHIVFFVEPGRFEIGRRPRASADLTINRGPAAAAPAMILKFADPFGAVTERRIPMTMTRAAAGLELTRLTRAHGPLTKRVHFDPDGKLSNDSSACWMARGTMERLRLDDWRQFADELENTPPNVAYALGAMKPELADSARLVTKRDPWADKPGYATRTQGTIIYEPGRPALVLIDFDSKGMTADVRKRLSEGGGFLRSLMRVCPEIEEAGYIQRSSTSAGIRNRQTGKPCGSTGQHLYVLTKDGSDAKRFLETLHDWCWVNGLGWYLVGAAGQLLDRSIIDCMVYAAERLVFEADAQLG